MIPKFLPCEAIKELLTKPTKRTEKQHAMVLNSIPTEWLQILKTETGKPDESFSIKLTPDTKPKKVTELTCRWLYTALILDEARSTELPYRQAWGITFGPINWENTFKNIQKNNFDRKANDLRWKILHRCLPTAKRLAGRSPFFPSSTCQVCKKYEENLTHLFFLCPSAKKIWKYITALIRQRFPNHTNYSVTFKDILCDFPDFDELRNDSVLDSYGMPASDIFGNIGILLFMMANSLKLYVSSKQKSNKKFKPNFRLLKYQENWKNFNETGRMTTY